MSFFTKDFRILSLAVLLGSLVLNAAVGQGQLRPIITVDPATEYYFNEAHGNGMVGWVFNLQQTVVINQVGWYDDGKDGLSRDYQIGLWQDLTGSPDSILVYCNFQTSNPYSIIGDPYYGVTIPAGTDASLNGSYRVVNLPSPITLLPGNYEIGGLDTANSTDPIRYLLGQHDTPVDGLTQGPFFYAYYGDTREPLDTLEPTQYLYLLDGLELGPMLFTSVPEPSAVSLLALSGLIYRMSRRRDD